MVGLQDYRPPNGSTPSAGVLQTVSDGTFDALIYDILLGSHHGTKLPSVMRTVCPSSNNS